MAKTKKTKSRKLSKGFSFSKKQAIAVIAVVVAVGGYFVYRSLAYNTITVSGPPIAIKHAGTNDKYWIATKDGNVKGLNGAQTFGSMAGKALNAPVTAFAPRSQRDGYWLLGGDGGVFAFGGAKFINRPPANVAGTYVAIVATPSGNGYWVVAKGGQIFKYGDATTLSSAASSGYTSINAGITKQNTVYGGLPGLPAGGIYAAARTGTGRGLVLLSSSGGVYTYGDAVYRGGATGMVSGEAATEISTLGSGSTGGYAIVTTKGRFYAFGSAKKQGDASGIALNKPVSSFGWTPGGAGYWMVAQDGGVFTYGDAQFKGVVTVTAPTTTTAPSTTTTTKPTTTTTATTTPTATNTGTTAPGAKNGDLPTCMKMTLKLGDKGTCVSRLIWILSSKGLAVSATEMSTSTFGSVTDKAVRAFQTQQKIKSDGVVGSETWARLTYVAPKDGGGQQQAKSVQIPTISQNCLVIVNNFNETQLNLEKRFFERQAHAQASAQFTVPDALGRNTNQPWDGQPFAGRMDTQISSMTSAQANVGRLVNTVISRGRPVAWSCKAEGASELAVSRGSYTIAMGAYNEAKRILADWDADLRRRACVQMGGQWCF